MKLNRKLVKLLTLASFIKLKLTPKLKGYKIINRYMSPIRTLQKLIIKAHSQDFGLLFLVLKMPMIGIIDEDTYRTFQHF